MESRSSSTTTIESIGDGEKVGLFIPAESVAYMEHIMCTALKRPSCGIADRLPPLCVLRDYTTFKPKYFASQILAPHSGDNVEGHVVYTTGADLRKMDCVLEEGGTVVRIPVAINGCSSCSTHAYVWHGNSTVGEYEYC